MLGWWTIGRASGIGAGAGLLGLALWPFQRAYPENLAWPSLVAAALAGLCGVSILVITAADLLFHRRRGRRVRPLRTFDVALGAALIALAWILLNDIRGQF